MSDEILGHCDLLNFHAYKTLLKRGKRLRCRVVSDSMTPVLRVGDLMEIEALGDPGTLARFDLIVFLQEERLISHFFWRRERLLSRPSLTTRSLKESLGQDIPVPLESVLGRVVDRRIPYWIRARVILANLMRGRG